MLAEDTSTLPAARPAPQTRTQLDLFPVRLERRLFPELGLFKAAVTDALGQGKLVGLRNGPHGFELWTSSSSDLPLTVAGFTRRPLELVDRALRRPGQELWARRAGPRWAGWIEWGAWAGSL